MSTPPSSLLPLGLPCVYVRVCVSCYQQQRKTREAYVEIFGKTPKGYDEDGPGSLTRAYRHIARKTIGILQQRIAHH